MMACPITDNNQRQYPLKQPDGWKPKVPRWTLLLPKDVKQLVVAYVGVQDRRGLAVISKANYSRINENYQDDNHDEGGIKEVGETLSTDHQKAGAAIESWTQQGDSKPIIVNRFETLAGRDVPGSVVWACYWTSKTQAEESLALLDLKKIYQSCQTLSGGDAKFTSSFGLWIEVINPDLTRFETNYAGDDYRPGLAELDGATLEPHNLTGYWGAARDRMRASAFDEFKDDLESVANGHGASDTQKPSLSLPNAVPLHLKGSNSHTIAHIRSGQFWERCSDVERDAYESSLEPYLLRGLADIFDRPKDLGDYGLRFLRNAPSDSYQTSHDDQQNGHGQGQIKRETCAAGFSRSLSHLEYWAKECPSHHQIYGGAISHKLKFKAEAKMRTWHEVCVLKPGEAWWEYIDCVDGTGTMPFQGGELVAW